MTTEHNTIIYHDRPLLNWSHFIFAMFRCSMKLAMLNHPKKATWHRPTNNITTQHIKWRVYTFIISRLVTNTIQDMWPVKKGFLALRNATWPESQLTQDKSYITLLKTLYLEPGRQEPLFAHIYHKFQGLFAPRNLIRWWYLSLMVPVCNIVGPLSYWFGVFMYN
jgi:hypothetical protein